jgi:DNA-binding NarL/FixJ family response regulator
MKTAAKSPRRKTASRPARSRVLVVDDHPLMRLAVREILRDQRDLVVCGEAGDAAMALQLLKETQPHLVLLDLSLGQDFGLDLIKQITKSDPSWRILVLSIYDEVLYAERALRAGARGYLNKRESSETILAAIRSVLAGKIHLPPGVIDHVLHGLSGAADQLPKAGGAEQLSDRELQTFELLGMGVGSREIAGRLGLSLKTVEVYRERIKHKFGLASSAELMRRAVEWVLTRT